VDYRNIDLSNKLASDLNINETSNQEVYTTNNNDDDDEDEDEDLKLAKHLQKEEVNFFLFVACILQEIYF
jgi:hypothetical protein